MTAKNRIHDLWARKPCISLEKKELLCRMCVLCLFVCSFCVSCHSVSTLHIINNSGKDFEYEIVNDFSENTEKRRMRYPFLCNNEVVFGSLKSVSEDLIFYIIDPITKNTYIYAVQIPQKKGLRPGNRFLQLEHDMSLYYISEDNLSGEHSIPHCIPVQQPKGYPIIPIFQTSKESPLPDTS